MGKRYSKKVEFESYFKPKTQAQSEFYNTIFHHDITIGYGSAGTGKTHVAVATACEALKKGLVKKLIFSRPAVEAGEKLGFLPGELNDKMGPYVRPIYDALSEILGEKITQNLTQTKALEVAPLAYLRGRTFNDSFIILDEAQNTTIEQMKMFLSRIGEGSCMVIIGDTTQNDLGNRKCGLQDAVERLQSIEEVGFTKFTKDDIVRHPLIGRILDVYEI